MNWKNILVSGACTGILAATFIIIVFVLAEIDPGSFAGLCGGFFVLAALPAAIVNQISKQAGWPDVPLKILIPVGFLTMIMPLLGATFGLPNSSLTSLATLVALGAVGGIFWSLPFVGWNYLKSRGNDMNIPEKAESTPVVQNITYNIQDSVISGDINSTSLKEKDD